MSKNKTLSDAKSAKTSQVKTSGTCPSGVDIPITAASFSVHSDHSEIRMTKTRQQLKTLGLLLQNDEDGVDEMAIYDVGSEGYLFNSYILTNTNESITK